jgi:iron complex outermembrane receptor protein
MNAFRSAAFTLSLLLILTPVTHAGEASNGPEELGTLEELDFSNMMRMEVTTASKQAQSISDIAAPVYVITADDIRRGGANSIPEALRLAPGVMVGQIDQGKWVVSLRGFGWQYANKALVLLDGRAVYSPLASIVYWDSLDVPMEDIERIEVIRGPGDARWGSHAVNGIVNIITKFAAETRGAVLSVATDTDGSGILTARHGAALSENLDYRVYAKYLSQGDLPMAAGISRLGDRQALRAGLRLDGVSHSDDRFTFIGDLQSGRDASVAVAGRSLLRYDADEWSALARWERGNAGRLKQQAQLSLDRLDQQLYEVRETLDAAYQAQLPEWHVHNFTLGATYKHTEDDAGPISVFPPRMTQHIYGAFVHDRIALAAKTKLLLGSQFEHNPFSGWEVQPNIQLLYAPTERRSFWASVSRAVRTPLRIEHDFNVEYPIFPGGFARITGNPDLQAESVLAWQAGTRLMLRDNLFLDFAAFYNDYEHLVLLQGAPPVFEPLPPPGRTIFPTSYVNGASGHTRGIEAALKMHPLARWDLAASYSLYSQTPWTDPYFGTVTAVEHQFQIHSSAGLTAHLEWNVDLYYTGPLTTGTAPDYYKLDSQLAWTPWKSVQLAIGVKNALDARHREVGGNGVDVAAEIPRTGYLRVLKQF